MVDFIMSMLIVWDFVVVFFIFNSIVMAKIVKQIKNNDFSSKCGKRAALIVSKTNITSKIVKTEKAVIYPAIFGVLSIYVMFNGDYSFGMLQLGISFIYLIVNTLNYEFFRYFCDHIHNYFED